MTNTGPFIKTGNALQGMKVTVLVPTYNEKENVGKVLAGIAEHKDKVSEILVVDGHSTDGTQETVRSLGHTLVLQEGRGLGNAIKTGIAKATGDVIIIVDADGSHDTKDIPKLIAKIEEGYDLVVASRYISGPRLSGLFRAQSSSYDDTIIRELGNRMFTGMVRVLYGAPIHDLLMGYKAFRKRIFEKITLTESGQQFDAEIVVKAMKAGYKLAEVPTVEYKREHGESKLSVPYHGMMVLRTIVKGLFTP